MSKQQKRIRIRVPKVKKPRIKAPNWLRAVGRVLKKLGFILIIFRPFRPIGRYFGGAWHELRQVNWPSRALTWKLTMACLLFTAILTVFIVALDFGFEQLVKKVLF